MSSLLQKALKSSSSCTKIAKTARRSMAAAASLENLVPTVLNQWHKDLGGEMVPFAGYELPVLYKGDNAPNGGVMKEHLWCRSEGKASLFDVSHMGQVRLDFLGIVSCIHQFCCDNASPRKNRKRLNQTELCR